LMRINGVEHIGIAVTNVDECIKTLERIFGLEVSDRQTIEASNVEIAFLPCGATKIELVTPTSESSPIAGFLNKRGNGIHHICLDVENIEAWLEALEQRGVRLIDKKPRMGAHGRKVAFIDPKSTCGFLIELSERIS